MSTKTPSRSDISGLTLLGILFVGLKLTNYIDWSWWWVTAPFWAPLALVLAVWAVVLLLAAIISLLK